MKYLIFLFILQSLSAADILQEKSLRQTNKYREISVLKNVEFDVSGKSYLSDPHYQYLIEKKNKVLLIWSGEAGGDVEKHRKITLKSTQSKIIEAEHFFVNYSRGKVFLSLAWVDLVPGRYQFVPAGEVKENAKFYGHAMVKTKPSKNKKTVKILSGLDAFYPGSVHGIRLGSELKTIDKIAIIGGHGLKGNGSTNLLNGIPLGTGDDWNGSSGKRWDIDLYHLKVNKLQKLQGKELFLEVDPLLQWLFPLVIIGSWN